MSGEEVSESRACAHCGYSLAGLDSTLCPECGKEQPLPTDKQLVRADRVWIALSLAGMTVFAVLAWLTLGLGTVLGGFYTGDQELVRATIGFAVIAGVYLFAAFEVYVRRSTLRRVDPLARNGGIATMVFAAVLGFVGVFLSLYL